MGLIGVPFSIIFTKVDKEKKATVTKNIAAFEEALQKDWEDFPPIFTSSSRNGNGRMEILNYIDSINQTL